MAAEQSFEPADRIPDGTEIRLFDPLRPGRPWTARLAPSQYALFISELATGMPYSSDGVPHARPEDCTCVVFDSLDAAEQFGDAWVRRHPDHGCELFDAEGRAHPPLLVIVHPDRVGTFESSPRATRHRRIWVAVLLLLVGPLLWLDFEHDFAAILPTFLALTCAIAAVRFFLWDYGVYAREKERRRRIAAHRAQHPPAALH